MSKPPRVRHSKTQREPVTIDLDPGAVSRIDEPPAGVGEEAVAAAAGEPTAEPTTESVEASAAEAVATETPASEVEREMPDKEPMRETETPSSAHAFGRGAEAASRPADVVPPPQPARRGSGLVGGVVGGALALAAAFGLNYAGLLPGGPVASGETPDLATLEAEVVALRADVEALKAAPGGAGVDDVRAAVTEAVSRIDGLAVGLEQVKIDLAALKTAVESGGAGDGAAVQALAARLAELEATVASLGQGSDVTPAQLQELAGKLAAVESAANAANSAAADAGAKVAALAVTVAELAARVDAQADQPKVALAIAAAALRAALERGGTFVAEVETFAAVAPSSPDLAALREIAVKGVATRADLVAAMPAAADAMIAASTVVDPNAGLWDRLVDSVTGLVTVRPIGEVPGEGVPERAARMEAALKRGDLVAALAEYDAMPDAAKAAGAELADKVRTRHAAEQLVEKALSEALKAS